MMPTIRIDDQVMALLKEHAKEPFRDTPNTVLRRLLGLDRKRTSQRPPERARRRGTRRTPQHEYRLPILRALVALGGKAAIDSVLKQVHNAVKGRLRRADYEMVSSGVVRWRNAAQWERMAMVQEGLLKPSTRKGEWEITESGRRYVDTNGR